MVESSKTLVKNCVSFCCHFPKQEWIGYHPSKNLNIADMISWDFFVPWHNIDQQELWQNYLLLWLCCCTLQIDDLFDHKLLKNYSGLKHGDQNLKH
jgi:hypothetical protein